MNIPKMTDEVFEDWWDKHGQFLRAGGGEYEKTFAFHAWEFCLAARDAQWQAALAEQEPVAGSAAWDNSEGWESLAWELCADENGEESCNELIWEGGPVPEPWGERWLKYEDEAKRLIKLVHKHVPAPTNPAAQERAEPVTPVVGERELFEREFPLWDAVYWDGKTYRVKDDWMNSYKADRYVGQWKAWLARAALSAIPPAPAVGAVLSEREFSEWLNANRNHDVSSIFHDTVAHYAAVLSATPPAPAQPSPEPSKPEQAEARAKELYAKYPTYSGTRALSWEEAPDVVRWEWHAKADATLPPASAAGEREAFKPDRLESIIDDYLEDYEMRGEDEDGRDACHTPSEGERFLIKDAIMGLLADDAWDAEWGKHIDSMANRRAALATKPQEATPPAQTVQELTDTQLAKAGGWEVAELSESNLAWCRVFLGRIDAIRAARTRGDEVGKSS